MFGIGWTELTLIAVVALLVVGPERLPQAAKTMGQLYHQIRRTVTEASRAIETEMALLNEDVAKPPQKPKASDADRPAAAAPVAAESGDDSTMPSAERDHV